MIHRVLLVASALLLATGAGALAVADQSSTVTAGSHNLCVAGGDTPTGPQEGICVWVPAG